MDDKKFNERVAMAMLNLCALVWEHCTISDDTRELTFSAVNRDKTYLIDVAKFEWPLFCMKVKSSDGVTGYDYRDRTVSMSFPKDDGFHFSFSLDMGRVFCFTDRFCKQNGCKRLLNNTVFGVDSTGKYARLPQVKSTPRRAVRAKRVRRPDVTGMLTVERLRQALLKYVGQAA